MTERECHCGLVFYGDEAEKQLAMHQAAVCHPHDPVDHPSHYTSGGIETIDAIEAWGLGFNLGNAVKYLSRAGKKDPACTLEDLRKAEWYVRREIARLEKGARQWSPPNAARAAPRHQTSSSASAPNATPWPRDSRPRYGSSTRGGS